MLDEPAAGLSGSAIRELGALIRRLAREWHIGILLIEHDVEFVMELCDEIAVLDFGRLIARGAPEVVRADPMVRAAYLGEAIVTDLETAPVNGAPGVAVDRGADVVDQP